MPYADQPSSPCGASNTSQGISRREYYAVAAMRGILSDHQHLVAATKVAVDEQMSVERVVAIQADAFAQALIDVLAVRDKAMEFKNV